MDINNLEKGHFEMSEAAANYLLGLVLEGKKRATSSSLWAYEIEGEVVPKVGDRYLARKQNVIRNRTAVFAVFFLGGGNSRLGSFKIELYDFGIRYFAVHKNTSPGVFQDVSP